MNTETQQRVAANMQSHIVVLRSQVAEEGEKVDILLSHQKEIEKDIQTELSALRQLRKEADKVKEQQELDLVSLNEYRLELQKYEHLIDEKIQEATEIFLEKENRLRNLITESQNVISRNEEHAFSVEERIKHLKDELNLLGGEVFYGQEVIQSNKETEGEVKLEISNLKTERDDILVNINSLRQELKELEVDNKIESTKAAEANLALSSREEEITKRERNLLIIKSRMSKVFAMLYPGQNMDNLI